MGRKAAAFLDWLREQLDRRDAVGLLARGLLFDDRGRALHGDAAILERLGEWEGVHEVEQTLLEALREWRTSAVVSSCRKGSTASHQHPRPVA